MPSDLMSNLQCLQRRCVLSGFLFFILASPIAIFVLAVSVISFAQGCQPSSVDNLSRFANETRDAQGRFISA